MAAPTQGLPLALTLGDPAGIGPELALRAWAAREHIETPFFLLGDVALMAPISRRLGLPTPVEIGSPAQTAASFNAALPVVALRNPASDAEPGKPSSRYAAASLSRSSAQSPISIRAKPAPSSPIPSPSIFFTRRDFSTPDRPSFWATSPGSGARRPSR